MTPAERIAELEGLLNAMTDVTGIAGVDEPMSGLECVQALRAVKDEAIVALGTARLELAQAQAEVSVAETDNSALLEELSASNESLCSDSAEERRKRWDYVADVVFEQPHPGTALLDELARLKKELMLIREAVDDKGLTDFQVRLIAGGVDRVTENDIIWAQDWLKSRGPARREG